MPVLPLLSLLLCSLLLSSCTSTETPSLSKGTGQYPNSIYVNTVSKDLDSVHVGNASSPVQLTIFTDYQCPACAVFHTGVENRLWKDYIETNKIGVTFMNYPLTMTNAKGKPVHPNAEWDALAALCSVPQGKFRAYRDALYALEHEKNGSSVSDEERVKLAKDLGMNESEFSRCLTEAWYQKTLNNEIVEGNRLNLQGTPSVYLNEAPLVFEDSDQLATIIEAALSKK